MLPADEIKIHAMIYFPRFKYYILCGMSSPVYSFTKNCPGCSDIPGGKKTLEAMSISSSLIFGMFLAVSPGGTTWIDTLT